VSEPNLFQAVLEDRRTRARRWLRRGLWLSIMGLGMVALSYFGAGVPLVLGVPLLDAGCVLAGVGAGLLVLGWRYRNG
jgi:hypothetical protein